MGAAGVGRATARLTLRSDARELRLLRQKLREFLDAHGVTGSLGDDLILVANELTTNAIEASALGTDVTVELRLDSAQIVLSVENVGPPFTIPNKVTLPEARRLRGRGLALTNRIVDELRAEAMVDGTRVVARCSR